MAAPLAILLAVLLAAVGPAAAETLCGSPASPRSCLAPCAGNPAMRTRRAALSPKARAGDAEALFQTGLSWLGRPGPGPGLESVPVCRPDAADYRAAAAWFTRAGQRGHAEAQAAMGDLHEHGDGVAKDYFRALDWFHKAAAQGHVRAIFRVGVFHDFGRAANLKDEAIAARWYAEAARRGSCDARFALATMYYRGRGIARDPVIAWALYDLVVERPYPVACYGQQSGDARRFRAKIAAQLTPDQAAAARRQARENWAGD